jgi:hypothetical protein
LGQRGSSLFEPTIQEKLWPIHLKSYWDQFKAREAALVGDSMSKRFEIKSPEVVYDEIDGEYVIVDLASGKYFRIQGESGNLFAWIISGQELQTNRDSLSGRIAELIDSTVRTLLDNSIIRDATAQNSVGISDETMSFELNEFVIEEFTDLQDIIGLDPIHEVDLNQGWPIADESR